MFWSRLRAWRADLLLHPVRLRLVKAFLGDRALTIKQLAVEMPDVPAGSIYRHVARLTEAGVLHVVAERRVRATIEHTYALQLHAAQVQPDEIAAMPPDEYADTLLTYAAGLLGDLDRYLATRPADPVVDGVSFRVAAMWLTDAELAEYRRELAAISRPRIANGPEEGRRRRMLYTALLPAPETRGDEPAAENP